MTGADDLTDVERLQLAQALIKSTAFFDDVRHDLDSTLTRAEMHLAEYIRGDKWV